MEYWERISSNKNAYYISTFGRVWSKNVGIIKLGKNNGGYIILCISYNGIKKTKLVHRLVAKAFIPNPKSKPQVNHINGNRQDNNIENLEWSTASENTLDALKRTKRIIDKTDCRPIIAYREGLPIVLEFYGVREAMRQMGGNNVNANTIFKHIKSGRKTMSNWYFEYL